MLRLGLGGVGAVIDVDEGESGVLTWKDGGLLSGEDEAECQSDRCESKTAAGAKTHEEYPRNSLNQRAGLKAKGTREIEVSPTAHENVNARTAHFFEVFLGRNLLVSR
jgi:hypothetical protein